MLQLSVKQVELEGAKEELELARADLKDTAGLAKDEMVQKAFEVLIWIAWLWIIQWDGNDWLNNYSFIFNNLNSVLIRANKYFPVETGFCLWFFVLAYLLNII